MMNSYIALRLDSKIVITNRLRRDIVQQFCYGM